jgi:hypothetical protein
LRVGLGGQQGVHGADLVVVGAQVDGGGVAAVLQVGAGGGVADEDCGVDFGGEGGGLEDAGEVEPHAAGPDPLAGPDAVDAQPRGGGGAEHRDRLAEGGGVEVGALGERGADRGGQPEAGRIDGQGVGVDGGDERAAVGAGARDGADVLHGVDAGQPGDHAGGGGVQFGGAAGDGLPVLHGQQVGA